jgi:hypothetical protein
LIVIGPLPGGAVFGHGFESILGIPGHETLARELFLSFVLSANRRIFHLLPSAIFLTK